MGLRMKISILWGLTEKSDFYGGGGGRGGTKNQYIRGGLGQFDFEHISHLVLVFILQTLSR